MCFLRLKSIRGPLHPAGNGVLHHAVRIKDYILGKFISVDVSVKGWVIILYRKFEDP
jgi:hypothetical protein